MKQLILSFTLFLCFAAHAHRTEVNILDTEAGTAAALAKVAGETGRYVNKEQGLTLLKKALAEVMKVKNVHYREVVLATIANEYASLDEIEAAIRITRSLTDVHLFVTNFGKIANKLVKADPAQAEKMLNEAVQKSRAAAAQHDLPALLAELSGKYVRLNRIDIARQLLSEANAGVEKINHLPLDEKLSLYAEIAANMVAAGQKEEAFQLFDKAYKLSNQLTDPFERAAILAMLGGELAEKGQPEKALRMLEEGLNACALIKDVQQRNDITSEIARNLSQSKKCEKGATVAGGISDVYFSCEALIVAAKNYGKLKQPDAAYALLQKLKEKTASISSPNKKAVILAKTAAELAEMGKGAEAKALLEEALKTLA